jgi:microcystin-dependent protein
MRSLEFDANFDHVATYLNTAFVDDAVTAVGALTGNRISPGTITSTEIAAGAIDASLIAADTITAAQLAVNSVTASELADNAVDTNALLNDAVTTAKLAPDAVDSTRLADDSVGNEHLQDNAVTGNEVLDNSVPGSKIQDGTITLSKLVGSLAPPAAVPTGTVLPWAGASLPAGGDYVWCDGAQYDPAVEVALFAVLGTNYNTGGETPGWFRTPDLRGRAPFGMDDFGGGEGDAARITAPDALGTSGGADLHQLVTGELPSHSHTITDPGHAHSTVDGGHSHGVTDPGHGHGVTDPGHGHTINDPGHKHFPSNGAGFVTGGQSSGSEAGTGEFQGGSTASDTDTVGTGIGINSSATGLTVNSGATGVSVDGATTGVTVSGNTTQITIDNAGADTAHENMPPYLMMKYMIAR